MITNWEELATRLNVLRPDGSETYTFHNSQEALEEILGEEWIRHAVDAFINGDKGNELAIKTVRRLGSRVAAEYAYRVFQANKDTDTQKARYAIWAMDDILHPICLKYADEFLDDPRFVNQAVWLIKELIYNIYMQFEPAEFDAILLKAETAKSDSPDDQVAETVKNLREFLREESDSEKRRIKNWYSHLELIRKRPFMYGVQRVEDIFLMSAGYAEALEKANATDEDFEHFHAGFMDFVVRDLNTPSHCNWSMAIRLYSGSDSASLDLFFEELAKYKSGKSDLDFDRVKYRKENKSFCCEKMADKVEESINPNGETKHEDVDIVMNRTRDGVYGIPIHDGGTSFIEINNCPWCGARL
jgi:hypothetical protein